MNLKRQIIQIELTNGLTVHAEPVTQAYLLSIGDDATEKFPEPDTKPFEKKLEGALDPEATYIDYQDVLLQRMLTSTLVKRKRYINETLFAERVSIPVDQRDELVAFFSDDLEKLKAKNPGKYEGAEDWQTVLFTFALVNTDDIQSINDALRWKMLVTQKEVDDQFIYFQPKDKRRSSKRID